MSAAGETPRKCAVCRTPLSAAAHPDDPVCSLACEGKWHPLPTPVIGGREEIEGKTCHPGTFEDGCSTCLSECYRQLWASENEVVRLKAENARLEAQRDEARRIWQSADRFLGAIERWTDQQWSGARQPGCSPLPVIQSRLSELTTENEGLRAKVKQIEDEDCDFIRQMSEGWRRVYVKRLAEIGRMEHALKFAPPPLRLGNSAESQKHHVRYATWFDTDRHAALSLSESRKEEK